MHHPDFDLLIRFLEERLTPTELSAFEAHLPCTDCEHELQTLSAVFTALATKLEEPAMALVEAAVEAFDRSPWKRPTLLERLTAFLQFDSRQMPALSGVRGAVGPVQLLFESNQIDFDLQLVSAETTTLIGQAMPHDHELQRVAGQPVYLFKAESLCATTETDRAGQFVFERVAPGEYEVVVHIEERGAIALPGVTV